MWGAEAGPSNGSHQRCLEHDKCGHLGWLKCGARQAAVTCSALSITRAVNATVWPPLPLPLSLPSPQAAPPAAAMDMAVLLLPLPPLSPPAAPEKAMPAPWLLIR